MSAALTTEEGEWICIVCLKLVASEEYPSAIQVELEVDKSGKFYFVRHSGCEMDDAARFRLAQIGREKYPAK